MSGPPSLESLLTPLRLYLLSYFGNWAKRNRFSNRFVSSTVDGPSHWFIRAWRRWLRLMCCCKSCGRRDQYYDLIPPRQQFKGGLTTVGWTPDCCGKRFNGSVTTPGDRLTGTAAAWARAKRRVVRRTEKERPSCIAARERRWVFD